MNAVTISVGIVINLVLGTTLLYLSLRVTSKAHGHIMRSAAGYLLMFVVGSLIGGGVLYGAMEVVSLRPVIAVVISYSFAAFCQWAVGCILFKNIVLRRGLAIAIPVILINFLSCVAIIPGVAKAEHKATQTRLAYDLRAKSDAILLKWYDNEDIGLPIPETLQAFSTDGEFKHGRLSPSDLDYLPEYLAANGLTGPYKSIDIKPSYPLLWIKTLEKGETTVVYVDRHYEHISRSDLEVQLSAAVTEIATARQERK